MQQLIQTGTCTSLQCDALSWGYRYSTWLSPNFQREQSHRRPSTKKVKERTPTGFFRKTESSNPPFPRVPLMVPVWPWAESNWQLCPGSITSIVSNTQQNHVGEQSKPCHKHQPQRTKRPDDVQRSHFPKNRETSGSIMQLIPAKYIKVLSPNHLIGSHHSLPWRVPSPWHSCHAMEGPWGSCHERSLGLSPSGSAACGPGTAEHLSIGCPVYTSQAGSSAEMPWCNIIGHDHHEPEN